MTAWCLWSTWCAGAWLPRRAPKLVRKYSSCCLGVGWLADFFDTLGTWAKQEGTQALDSTRQAALAQVIDCCMIQGLWTDSRRRQDIRLQLLYAMTRYGTWCWDTTIIAKKGEAVAEMVLWHLADLMANGASRVKALEVAGGLLSLSKPAGRLKCGHRPPNCCCFVESHTGTAR